MMSETPDLTKTTIWSGHKAVSIIHHELNVTTKSWATTTQVILVVEHRQIYIRVRDDISPISAIMTTYVYVSCLRSLHVGNQSQLHMMPRVLRL